MRMTNRQLPSSEAHSVAAVLDALAERLPPRHKQCVRHSEVEFSNTDSLKRMLDQGSPVVASYINTWLGGLDRYSDLFVTWTYGSLGSFFVLMLIGGVLGIVEAGNFQAVVTFGFSIVVGLGLAIRYSRILPHMAEQSVTLIDGGSKELVHACREFNDQPVERLIRIPLNHLAVKLSWGQYADHAPSFISVFLLTDPSIKEDAQKWHGLCLTTVNHSFPAPAPEELVRQAKEFAEILGARYVGMEQWSA